MNTKRQGQLHDRIVERLQAFSGGVGNPGPTWRAQVKLFAMLDFVDEDHIWMGAEAVYGWMPRMLRNVHEPRRLLKLVRQIRQEVGVYRPGQSAFAPASAISVLGILEKFLARTPNVLFSLETASGPSEMNHSVVATSKFLHFLVPHLIPIWDSRVAESVKKAHQLFTAENYLEYVGAVQRVALSVADGSQPSLIPRAIRSGLRKSVGMDVPLVRQIEFALYMR